MIKQTSSINMATNKTSYQSGSQCVCQICTCHKHKCPHSKINIPFDSMTTYDKQFVPHPLGSNPKFSTDNPKYNYNPYGYINSSYREDYPGHKPAMREKLVPRVKNQNKDVPFGGQSWYKSTFTPKSVNKDRPRIKDQQLNPCLQPFNGFTTYANDFYKKRPQSHVKRGPDDISYPQGYKFNGSTTYGADFIEKGSKPVQSCKPVQRVAPKGKHYLNSTYRSDYNQKQSGSICPVLTLPKYPEQINYPNQHVSFNKNTGIWDARS